MGADQNKVVRIRLQLAYVGTRFSGWQIQPRERTVQGCLEEILARMVGPVRVHGASRTDAGVHALGQVAHFDIPQAKQGLPWQKALNAQLPKDVSVLEASPVPSTFHSRYSPSSKEYTYTLWQEMRYVLPQRRPYVWQVPPLNCAAMQLAMQLLEGEHDFASFQNVGSEVKSTVRKLERIRILPGQHPCETVLRFRANGFLKQMVRNMTGTLYAVGTGALQPEKVRELLHARDRSLLPATAPPQGLCLEKIEYRKSADSS